MDKILSSICPGYGETGTVEYIDATKTQMLDLSRIQIIKWFLESQKLPQPCQKQFVDCLKPSVREAVLRISSSKRVGDENSDSDGSGGHHNENGDSDCSGSNNNESGDSGSSNDESGYSDGNESSDDHESLKVAAMIMKVMTVMAMTAMMMKEVTLMLVVITVKLTTMNL